ncbi:MAG: response regulator [Paracoccaceae bacterium]
MPERRIMILEDEAIIAWDIEAELQGRGMTVVGVAGRVADAMAIVERGDVTMAILDINLGHQRSFDLADLCRQKGIGVVFLTGDSGDERPDALKSFEVVAKPVNYELLVQALERVKLK